MNAAVSEDPAKLVGWPYGKDGAEVAAEIATRPHSVYQAIAAVIGDLSKDGIAKDRKNDQQGYKFRGIDEVYNALSPLLAKHKLLVLPRMLERNVVERESRNGGALFYITVKAEFDFVSANDGSKHVVGPMYGEAMDSGDKATNKAMSAAYKYAAMQAFCIPTEGDNDADAQTHEVVSVAAQAKAYAQRFIKAIEDGKDELICELKDELRGSQELELAIWAQLSAPVRRKIKDVLAAPMAKESA